MKNRRAHKSLVRALLLAVVGFLVLVAPLTVAAQSCALCYTQAASSTNRFIQALRSGIIILMVPPAFLSVGITIISYRRRNQFAQSDTDWPEHADR